jgi:prepilin-type N-terminal cleavage/methylation domain-containing protein
MRSRAKSGFSLIEALVALVITGVGIAGLVGALGNAEHAESFNLRAEKMQKLAITKLDEILATKDFTTASGDFSLEGEPDFEWTMTDDTTSVTDLDNITVRVSKVDDDNVWRSVSSLTYKVPNSTGGAQ